MKLPHIMSNFFLNHMVSEPAKTFGKSHIGFQLCEVFAYLHSVEPPILKQDLHSSNVLRLADGSIKLIDFGRARSLSSAEAAEEQPFDISDIRHLLSSLLPPSMSGDDFWRVRGVHPSLQSEDAGELRVALAALERELCPPGK